MSNDIVLVFGIILLVLAFPAMINAYSSSRSPRTGAVLLVLGGGMAAWAAVTSPTGYPLDSIPSVFVKVFGQIVG